MKIKNLILLFILCCYSFSQEIRYIDEIFEDVLITEDVVYGNAPDLPFIFLFEWNTVDIDLDMDIYEPAGDTEVERPVIVFLHAGAFFSGYIKIDSDPFLLLLKLIFSVSFIYLFGLIWLWINLIFFNGMELNFYEVFEKGAKPFLGIEAYKLGLLTIISKKIFKIRRLI